MMMALETTDMVLAMHRTMTTAMVMATATAARIIALRRCIQSAVSDAVPKEMLWLHR